MSLCTTPWSIARHHDRMRRALLMLMLGVLLYGLGVQAARACLPTTMASHAHAAALSEPDRQPCHDEVGVSQLVCESHCRTDVQSTRLSFSFDLPAAAPLHAPGPIAPLIAIASSDGSRAAPPRDNGPPLHLLFQRFLR